MNIEIKNKIKFDAVIWMVVNLATCLVIIFASGIEFQFATKVVLLLVTAVCSIDIATRRKQVGVSYNTRGKKICRYLLYAYSAFAFVGQRILIYPLTIGFSVKGMLVFTATYVWSISIIDSFLWILDKAGMIIVSEREPDNNEISLRGNIIPATVVCALLVIPAAIGLIAFNPGISLQDTFTNMIENAHNLRGMLDWHPAFYAMILKVILSVWDSTYSVLIVQYVFWAYVMVSFFMYIRKKGFCDPAIYVLAFLTGINSANLLLLNTILKDVLYTYDLVWIVLIIAKLTIDYDEYKRKWYIYIEMILALLGIYMLRKNGFVTFAVIAVCLVLACRKNIKIWIGIGITAILILLVKGPLYDYWEIEPTGRFGMYIGLSQDILGVYFSGGEVSDSTKEMIDVMTDVGMEEYYYTPTWSLSSYYLDVEPSEFILNYMDTFVHNPIIMTRAIIDRIDAVWDVYEGQDSVLMGVDNTFTMDAYATWLSYYPAHVDNVLTAPIKGYTTFTDSAQWIDVIIWRAGLMALLGLSAFVYLIVRKGFGRFAAIMAPMLGQLFSLLLSTGWSEYRYFWPLNLMNLCVICFTVIILRDNRKNNEAVSSDDK